MKIGIVSECFDPTLNGVTVSIHAFKEILSKNNEIFIFAPETKGYTEVEKNVFRYPSTTLFGPKDYPIALTPKIMKDAKGLGLDIIHCQHSLGPLSNDGMKFSKKMNIPIVHTYHTLLTEYIHWKVGVSFGKWFVKTRSTKFCNHCNQIVTPSDAMKKIILGYGVKTPIESIPTGINLSDYQNPFSRDELSEKWKIPKDKKLLLYLSRVASEKNLDFLLDAIKNLSQNRNDFHLILAGGGAELPAYQKKVADMGLDGIITFTDKLDKPIANRLFGAASIFVFPSVTETQGIVISEAMAAGIPAVAINEMGPSGIIKNEVDGFLCDLNLDQFTAKIESLLSNEELRNKLGSAAKINAQEFSKETCGAKMEKLYERTIANYNHSS